MHRLPLGLPFDRITAEHVDLYRHVLVPGGSIPVSIEPFPVEYSVPTEAEIEWAVKWLQKHRYGGPSGMWIEHLKGWLMDSQNEEAAEEK